MGVFKPLAAQLYLIVPAAVWDPRPAPVKVMAPTLIVPPAVLGVGLWFVYSATPVGRVRNPSRLPRAISASKLPCSKYTPAPARITVLPLPLISHARPALGAKLL